MNEFKVKNGLIVDQGGINVTGSSLLSGSVAITGSLSTIGSNTLIGSTSLTGSLSISGSTTQIGNNTLLGNTVLSGSIIISSSFPVGSLSSSVQIYGDTTMTGYLKFEPKSTNIDTSISASYIYVSGSTNDLYFSQNGNGYSNVTRLRWLEGNLYTGLLHGGLITTQSSTVYQVSSGSGIIVTINASLNDDPYPTTRFIEWPNLSASIAPLSQSFDQTFVAIEPTGSTGIIYVQGIPYDDGAFNTIIPIGNVIHQDHATINATATYPSVAYAYKQRTSDFIRAFGALKLSGLNTVVSGSSTGSIAITSGTSYSEGRNYRTDPNNPSYVLDTGQPNSKIYRYYQSGSSWEYLTNGGAGYTTIDPTQYSNNGTLTAVPGTGINRQWTIQRVYYFAGGATKGIYVYYGNATYDSQIEAVANIPYETFVEAPNTAAGAVLSAYLIVRNNANFTVADSYSIQQAGLFRNIGGAGGGGSSATTRLVDLSDVSITTPLPHQPLAYDDSTLKWTNQSAISASLKGNADTATTASWAINALTASSADNFTVRGTLTAQTLIVQTITASVEFVTGSTKFGSVVQNTHQFTGSVSISGSLSINGTSFTTATSGTSGTSGANGSSGSSGSSGSTGTSGSSGTSGANGTSGSSGSSGSTGSSGTSGANGTSGSSGSSGSTGTSGSSGTSGANGSSGTSGSSGSTGSSGTSGANGTSGSSGTTGSSGSSGSTGSSGTSGTSGSSGSSGSAGSAGSSGTSGTGFNTITNAADNRVITSLGTSNTANAEANLTFDGSVLNVTGNVTATGDITARTLIVQTVSSSVVYSSGSNIFGDSIVDTHDFTGSVRITGSLAVNNSSVILGTGSANQIAYWNGTNTQTGSNNLFWDAANSRLGIGTNAPSVSFDLRGKARIESTTTCEFDFINGSNSVRLALSSTTGFVGTLTSLPFAFFTAATRRGEFSINGNFLIGNTTDGGQRLQVYGDALISNSAASGTFFEVKRTSTTDRFFRVLSTGNIEASSISTGDPNFQFLTGANNTSTTGDRRFFWLQNNFSPTSGIATYRTLELTTVINQTGGANGITRGLYVNPTLTAAADWRSIEWSNNTGWGLYGAGTANNYLGGKLLLNSNSDNGNYSLQVNGGGSIYGSGNLLLVKSTGQYLLMGEGTGNNQYGILNWDATNNMLQISTQPFEFGTSGGQINLPLSGNILLGTTTDAGFKLDVNGTARVSGAATFSSSVTAIKALIGDNGFGSQWAVFNHADSTGASNAFVGIDNSNGSQISNIKTNGTFEWRVSNSNVMNLKTSGNLLVGTTTDAGYKLDVNGTARVTGNLTAASFIKSGGTSSQYLMADGSTSTLTNPVTGTGTTNYLPKWTSASAIGNSVIYEASGSIGVGTTALTSGIPLTINAPTGSNTNLAIQQNGTDKWYLRNISGTDDFSFYSVVNSAERMRITSGGNLLVGTTTDSGDKLQVNGTIKADGRIFINAGNGNQLYLNNAGQRYTQITFDNNSTSISQAYLAWDSVANFFEMYAKIGGGLKFYANQSEAMCITTSSFVGIGTSTPSYKLDVNRSSLGAIAQFITLDGTYNPRLLINGTSEGIQLFATYSSGGAEALMFGTANTERMRLTSNLIIGSTVDSGERLQVNGNGTFGGRTIVGASYIADLGGVGNNCGILFGPGAVLSIDGTGSLTTKNLGSSANTWGTVYATSFIKSGGTSSQYLMADGSVTTGSALTITNRQTASYTLALTDADKLVEMNVATANNLTVPLNSSVAFAIGTKIDLAQYGAGQTTVVATSGVTVRSAGGALKLALQYSGASLVKIATNEWYLFGDITV